MYKKLCLSGGVLTMLAMLLAGLSSVGADATSTWLAPSPLTLQKQGEFTLVPTSLNGNIDCFKENGLCVVNAFYGTANTSSAVKLNGTSSYRTVISPQDNQAHMLAIPNSNTVLSYTTGPSYGLNFYFTNNFSSSITAIISNGEQQYKINRTPDAKLADKTNHLLASDYQSMSFSPNSQWMVVSEPNVAMLRVNLQTFEVLPFGASFDYTIGLSPAPQTAITNDGRYVVVVSKDFSRFIIYDLSTCGAVPNTINGPVNCQSRDLQGFLQQQIAGYTNSSNLRFISDDTLSLYASYLQGSVRKTAKYLLSTATGTINQLDYLAIGESYISGEGAFRYQPGTDTEDNKCHLSLASYPYLMARDLNYNSYHSVACSGAKTPDILDRGNSYEGQVKNKITRDKRDVQSILTSFQPGYINQLDFASLYQPKVVTISIGGNDIGFSGILRRCLEPDICLSTYEDRVELVREINNQLFPRLVDTYQKVKVSTVPDARIYAVGYPQIAKPDGDCAANVHFSSDELNFASQFIDYLDVVIQKAAQNVGVSYVDTQNALYDHRLCEAQPGSVAVNGLTAGSDIPDVLGGAIGNESYHPNELGHQFLENTVLTASQNLTLAMPTANSSIVPPAESGLAILDAPKSGRAINSLNYDDRLGDDVTYRSGLWSVTVKGIGAAIKPLSLIRAVLQSSPVQLGNFTTDSKGDFSGQLQIPNDISAGFHTLHLYGTNLAGEPIDIYKTIFVGASQTDLDGDSILNSTDSCPATVNSGVDYDKDGTDDACDGFIALPPVIAAPVEPTPPPPPSILPSPPSPVDNSIAVQSQLPSDSGNDTTPEVAADLQSNSVGNDLIQSPTALNQIALEPQSPSTNIQTSNLTATINAPESHGKVLSAKTTNSSTSKTPVSLVNPPIHTKNWQVLFIIGSIFVVVLGLPTIQQLQKYS